MLAAFHRVAYRHSLDVATLRERMDCSCEYAHVTQRSGNVHEMSRHDLTILPRLSPRSLESRSRPYGGRRRYRKNFPTEHSSKGDRAMRVRLTQPFEHSIRPRQRSALSHCSYRRQELLDDRFTHEKSTWSREGACQHANRMWFAV